MTTTTTRTFAPSTTNSTCLTAMGYDIPLGDDCDFISIIALSVIIVSVVLIIVGLFTNIVLLVVIYSNDRWVRSIPSLLMANMASLGILTLVVVAGSNVVIYAQVAFRVVILRNDKLDMAIFYSQIFIAVTSYLTLVCLALDQYLSIVHPLRSRPYRTRKRALVVCAIMWIVSGLTVVPIIANGGSRSIFNDYRRPTFKPTLILYIVFIYCLPFATIVIAYAAVLKVVWCNPTSSQISQQQRDRRWRQRIKVLQVVTVIIVTNVAFQSSFLAVLLWIANGGHTRVSVRVSSTLLAFSMLLPYLNVCINPLVYGLNLKSFRLHVYRIICPPKRFKSLYGESEDVVTMVRSKMKRPSFSFTDHQPDGSTCV